MKRLASLGSLCSVLPILALVAIPATATAFDRFVNPFGTCAPELVAAKPTHDTIQQAVDASAVGDLIGVCPGTYAESVAVATGDLTIRPTGASAVHVVAPGPGGPSFGFDVSASGVTILGFEVSGFGGHESSCGIRVTGTDVTVTDTDVHDNVAGICLIGAISGLVKNNRIHDNAPGNGLFILFGRDNTAIGNRVLHNSPEGINDVATLRSLLQQNILNDNASHGIIVNSSVSPRVSRNTAQENAGGITIYYGSGAVVDHNVASANRSGIIVAVSSGCIVRLNRASENTEIGFGMSFTSSCLFDGNRAIGNGDHGIVLVGLGPGNAFTRNVATGNSPPDCQWDGSDAPLFQNNSCTTEVPPGAWD